MKAHLMPKYGYRASACSIGLFNALGQDFLHQIVILVHINNV
jgi:hypothetical protein